MNYTTQMDAARKGIVTEAMKTVSRKESMPMETLMERVADGSIAIPANINHTSLDHHGVGLGLSTKVNVNLGISKDCNDLDLELAKVRDAIRMKADAIMDLSCFGKTEEFRRRLVGMSTAMIGTVPIYDAVGYYDRRLRDLSASELLDVIEKHAQDGVDFMTIHAGLNRETVETFRRNSRQNQIVSRGGSLMYAWMVMNGKENPFFEHYDEILKICEKYDVTVSLGDACRPGGTADATDASQVKELITLGELTKRAWKRNVQIIVEGPGHMALDEIAANVKLQKRLCHNAPFYVLGPLVTDVAPGYDHITAAIGGAVASAAGVDFLCYVTPAEHLRLPDREDVKEGLIATRIAAHAGDIAKGVKGARDWDNSISKARQKLDWEQMMDLAMDSEKARRYRQETSTPEVDGTCTMCGKMCAVKNMNTALAGEDVEV